MARTLLLPPPGSYNRALNARSSPSAASRDQPRLLTPPPLRSPCRPLPGLSGSRPGHVVASPTHSSPSGRLRMRPGAGPGRALCLTLRSDSGRDWSHALSLSHVFRHPFTLVSSTKPHHCTPFPTPPKSETNLSLNGLHFILLTGTVFFLEVICQQPHDSPHLHP